MAEPQHEAFYKGIPTQATYNVNPTTKAPYVCVVMRITEGPLEGREFKFEQSKWDRERNVFTFRNMRGLGWQGKSMSTFVSDVRKTEMEGKQIAFQARLAEYNGKTWWTANRIGGGTLIKQGEAPTADTNAMMDDWIAEADQADTEFRASRGQRGSSGGDGPGDAGGPPADGGEIAIGPPCGDCGNPIFRHKDGYLTCSNGHDIIPF
jgi:hypothetical protein